MCHIENVGQRTRYIQPGKGEEDIDEGIERRGGGGGGCGIASYIFYVLTFVAVEDIRDLYEVGIRDAF